MSKFTESNIFFSLNLSDIQTVANQEIERDLSKDELLKIIDDITKNINWFDAISYAINKNIT